MNNFYNEAVVPPSTPTIVNGVTVPARGAYSLKGLIIWCEADMDITVKLNIDKIGGGRITGAQQTLFLDYSSSPFGLQAGDVVSVMATEDPDLTPPGAYTVYSTLLVEQL